MKFSASILLTLPVIAMLLASCGGSDLGAGFVDAPVAVTEQVASGAAAVSSAHPLASQAGRELLMVGGNAVDAAVATGMALAVVENSMSGLGGRAQILARLPNGELHGIDAQTQLGSTYSGPMFLPKFSGVSVVGVPGVVAGLLQLHEQFGARPRQEVMAPAIRYASEGYEILPGEVSRHLRVEKTIRKSPALAAIYLNDKQDIRAPGDVFVQDDLANTLRAIAAGGADVFYRGQIGKAMAKDLRARESSVSESDISSYQAREATVIQTDYRGYTVVATTSPANGTAVVAALNVLEQMDLSSLSETSWANVVNQTMVQVMQRTVLDDPDDQDYQSTISKERAKEFFEALEISASHPVKSQSDRVAIVASDQSLAMSIKDVDWSGAAHGEFSHHTSHYVAADDQGMVVTITQTLGPNMGSKIMTPGLGFIYAQTGGMPGWVADTQPGDRPRTSIAPTVVLKDGKPVMALGAAGGLLIPPAIVQVISRVIDRGATLSEAIAAPRVAPKLKLIPPSGYVADTIIVEQTPVNGWSDEDIAEFKAAGLKVELLQKYSLFGRVNAVAYDAESKEWTAVADPDWEGSAQVISP